MSLQATDFRIFVYIRNFIPQIVYSKSAQTSTSEHTCRILVFHNYYSK